MFVSILCLLSLCAHLFICVRCGTRFQIFSLLLTLHMYCYYKCSVALPHSAMGLQCAIVVFPDHTHFLKAKVKVT